MVHKVSEKKLKAWIKEEQQGAEEYYKYGFPEQARDELKHSFHFQNILMEKKLRVK